MSQKILVIEDEKNIARFIELELQYEHFHVEIAADGRTGLDMALAQHYDCILLDVMLPQLNGIEVCRRIRKSSNVPILLLTARDAVMDRVAGLDAGADDYIVKPFAIEELLARIRAALRRSISNHSNDAVLQVRQLSINTIAYEVSFEGKKLELTKTEYELLKLLVENKNRVCSRDMILEHVWGFETDVETNVVDVYIRHLRNKLQTVEAPYVETVRGVGYVVRE